MYSSSIRLGVKFILGETPNRFEAAYTVHSILYVYDHISGLDYVVYALSETHNIRAYPTWLLFRMLNSSNRSGLHTNGQGHVESLQLRLRVSGICTQ